MKKFLFLLPLMVNLENASTHDFSTLRNILDAAKKHDTLDYFRILSEKSPNYEKFLEEFLKMQTQDKFKQEREKILTTEVIKQLPIGEEPGRITKNLIADFIKSTKFFQGEYQKSNKYESISNLNAYDLINVFLSVLPKNLDYNAPTFNARYAHYRGNLKTYIKSVQNKLPNKIDFIKQFMSHLVITPSILQLEYSAENHPHDESTIKQLVETSFVLAASRLYDELKKRQVK